MLYDVFISHASEDKDDFVRPLAQLLSEAHIEVWYDEFSMEVGDSLRRSIDRGLANSEFGIVVLSPAFLRKGWPQRELDGLVQREICEDRRLILPIWHGVTRDQICSYSPPLADSVALQSSAGLRAVADALVRKIRPERSPLIVAREILISFGYSPPVISDEWWLELIEDKEKLLASPDCYLKWIFPLPHSGNVKGRQRGENIASTAMQLDWSSVAAQEGYCQLTHPDELISFIHETPGLLETARANAETLALYAPQLTIPGFDDGLEEAFDELLASGEGSSARYGKTDTVGNLPALCGEIIAWRHPRFGNYEDYELAYDFVSASNINYSRHSFNAFDCLVWLISDASYWLPSAISETLISGMRRRDHWHRDLLNLAYDDFTRGLMTKTRKGFRLTRQTRSDLTLNIEEALGRLNLTQDPKQLTERFLERDFIGGFYDWHEELCIRRWKPR